MRFILPAREGWSIRDEPSRFLILDHEATQSQLLIARWLGDRGMNRSRCEERARLWRDLPERSGRTLAQRYVDIPEGYDTELWAGVAMGDGKADGSLLAFGARGRHCFAFVLSTEATGPGAEDQASDRVLAAQAEILEELELLRDTEVVIPR